MAKTTSKTRTSSLAAYARHRNMAPSAVSRAIGDGRLAKSVGSRDGKPFIRDVDLADREWAANTQTMRRKLAAVGAAGAPVIAVSNARIAAARAEIAELELAERKGKLIAADAVAAKFVEVVTSARGKLLGLATRVKQRLPHIVADDVRVIDDLVREALEGLADGG